MEPPDYSGAIKFKVEPHPCGFVAGFDQDKLNQVVDELEVEAVAAKLSQVAT